MGCCESNEERGNIHMSSIAYNKTNKTGKSYYEDYRNESFESEAETELGAEIELYSDFSEENSSDDHGEETDWEDLSQDVQLERIGKSKEMFLK